MSIHYPKRNSHLGFKRTILLPKDRNIKWLLLKIEKLPLLKGGYEENGIYWGEPNNVYWLSSTQEVETEYGSVEQIEFAVRASSKEDAIAQVKQILPNSTVY